MNGDKTIKAKALLKNIFLFLIGGFVPKIISFLLVPLYTEKLTTAEYGTIDLIAATVQLLAPIFTLQVQDAALRFAMDRDENQSEVFSSCLRIVLIGFILIVLGCAAFYFCGFVGLRWEYIVYFLLSYAIGSISNIFGYFLRAVNRVSAVAFSAIINSALTVSFNLLFLLLFDLGWRGYLAANTIGSFAAVLFMFFHGRLRSYVSLKRPNRDLTRRIIIFSAPMAASALSWWANNSLDKYILTYLCGVGSAGLLAAAYKIPSVLSLFGAAISKGFSISAIDGFSEEGRDGFLGETYSAVGFFMTVICSSIMVLNVPISKFLFAGEFFSAWKLTPPLLIANLMSFMSLMCEQVFIALKRTRLIFVTAVFGALFNSALNFLLIPFLGAYGAAVSTAIGFFSVWAIRYTVMKRIARIKTRALNELTGYSLLVFQAFFALSGNGFAAAQTAIFAAIIIINGKTVLNFIKSFSKK